MEARERRLLTAAVVLMLLLGVSGLRAYDRPTWLLEVAAILLALPVLIATRRRFPLTPLLYGLIFLPALILMMGGAYTYARVPLGAWFASVFSLSRNPYDKLGHFAQGFVPALVAREVLVRGRRVRGRGMLAFVVLSIVLAISASYELVEWLAAVCLGQGADEFLGTQGDPWDTQSDMLMALIGGLAAIATLSGVHDRQLRDLGSPPAGSDG